MQNKKSFIYQAYTKEITHQRVPSFSKGEAGVVCITDTFSSETDTYYNISNKYPNCDA